MNNKLTLIKIIVCILCLNFQLKGYAQKRDLKKELMVYILPDSLEIPKEGKREIRINEALIASKSLKSALLNLNPIAFRKSFPERDETDSIKITKDGKRIKKPAFHRIFTFVFKDEKEVERAMEVLKKNPAVLYAHKHTQPIINVAPTNSLLLPVPDPDFSSGKQWHLKNDGRNGGTVGADIKAEAAWNTFTGSSAVTIAFFDTGIELTHDDLSGKATGDGYVSGSSVSYHGTHISGIAAGNANNGKGGRGVDWNAQVLSKNILNPLATDSVIALAIESAANSGAQINNHSWGGPFYSETIGAALAYAFQLNTTTIASTGNDAMALVLYPAGYNHVIAVGATTNTDALSSFSNTGSHVDVVAPGGIDGTTNARNIFSSMPGNTFNFGGGTSMAAPQVSGLASLLLGYRSTLYNDDIENLIKISADDKGSSGYDNSFGFGRINAGKAIEYLKEPYSLTHYTATGGIIGSTSGPYSMKFMGLSGLADGTYNVKKHYVYKTVTLPSSSCGLVGVWGVGLTTTGLVSTTTGGTNFGEGFCEVVSGTLTSTTVMLATYVYEIFNSSSVSLGYYPTSPANVTFGYTILGKLPPSMSGSIAFDIGTPENPLTLAECEFEGRGNFVFTDTFGNNSESPGNSYEFAPVNGANYSFTMVNGIVADFTINSSFSGTLNVPVLVKNNFCWSTDYFYLDIIVTSCRDNMRFIIYPNPSSEQINITKKQQDPTIKPLQSKMTNPTFFEVKLYDQKGKELRRGKTDKDEKTIALSTSTIANGTYFLHIIEGKNIIKKQIIIKH